MSPNPAPDLSYAALSAYIATLPDSATFGYSAFTCPLAVLAKHQGFPHVVFGLKTWRSFRVDALRGELSGFGKEFVARYCRLSGRNHRVGTVKRILADLSGQYGTVNA